MPPPPYVNLKSIRRWVYPQLSPWLSHRPRVFVGECNWKVLTERLSVCFKLPQNNTTYYHLQVKFDVALPKPPFFCPSILFLLLHVLYHLTASAPAGNRTEPNSRSSEHALHLGEGGRRLRALLTRNNNNYCFWNNAVESLVSLSFSICWSSTAIDLPASPTLFRRNYLPVCILLLLLLSLCLPPQPFHLLDSQLSYGFQ